jgi:citrate synthase
VRPRANSSVALPGGSERAAVNATSAKSTFGANVEFYTAALLDALSLPRSVFSAVFACARIAGYAAHYAEQRASGRLIRPSALYIGPRAGEA